MLNIELFPNLGSLLSGVGNLRYPVFFLFFFYPHFNVQECQSVILIYLNRSRKKQVIHKEEPLKAF